MSQAEGPETQVGGRVGDAAQTVLYGVDGLVDSDVPKVKLWKDKMVGAHTVKCVCVCAFTCRGIELMRVIITPRLHAGNQAPVRGSGPFNHCSLAQGTPKHWILHFP